MLHVGSLIMQLEFLCFLHLHPGMHAIKLFSVSWKCSLGTNLVSPIVAQFVFQSMAQISSCMDPLLFAFVSTEFRQDVKGILSCKYDKENNANFNHSLAEAFAEEKQTEDTHSNKLGKV